MRTVEPASADMSLVVDSVVRASAAPASIEVDMISAVFGVTVLEPGVELPVVGLALLAAVAACIVAEVQLPPPTIAAVRGRAVRREAAKDGHVARRQL